MMDAFPERFGVQVHLNSNTVTILQEWQPVVVFVIFIPHLFNIVQSNNS
jgi:hypothetical protein